VAAAVFQVYRYNKLRILTEEKRRILQSHREVQVNQRLDTGKMLIP